MAALVPTNSSPLPVALPTLTPGQVNLHLIPLDCTPPELARLEALLAEHELERFNKLLDPQRRDRATAGRGYLRQILGCYLDEEPHEVLLSEGEFGKPHLSDHLDHDSLSFNVSHAGGLLLVAVCSGCEVGVDLEAVREDISFTGMAERYFSPDERRDLVSLPQGEQVTAFYRCWTRKEAYLKACGTGFSQPSNGFDVTLLPGEPAQLRGHRSLPREIERWSIRDIEVPPGFCAALAVEFQNPKLRMFAR
jgi:4'-phosphopantetheinyl transferase